MNKCDCCGAPLGYETETPKVCDHCADGLVDLMGFLADETAEQSERQKIGKDLSELNREFREELRP